MKIITVSIALLALFSGCSKEEVKLEAFSPEAFAYDLGESWEVNASINVKGFKQSETDGKHTAALNYSVDLITTNGDTIKNIFTDDEQIEKEEEILDAQLEAQFELDSSFTEGKYILLFYITDESTANKTTSRVEFDLSG